MDELLVELKEVIEAGKMGVFQIADFVKAQAPDLVNQILRWNVYKSVMLILITAPIVYFTSRSIIREQRNKWKIVDDTAGGIIVIWVVLILSTGIVLLNSVFELGQILVAPKLYIFDYVRSLLSN